MLGYLSEKHVCHMARWTVFRVDKGKSTCWDCDSNCDKHGLTLERK